VELLPACNKILIAATFFQCLPSPRGRSPCAAVTGDTRELSGQNNDSRSSGSRFRGRRRDSQIHHPTGHDVVLSTLGSSRSI
jgi:hypothetical protein